MKIYYNVFMNIGEKIRELRLRKGLSPERLGMLSDISGGYIRKLESGQNISITLATAKKLAAGLGVKASDLIEEVELPQPEKKAMPELIKEIEERYEEIQVTEVPIIGSIPTDKPCDKEIQQGRYINISRGELVGREESNLFALVVSGDTLSRDNILDKDVIIFDQNDRDIIDGRLYVIQMSSGCVVRHVYKNNNVLRLVSSDGEENLISIASIEIKGRAILAGRWNKL